MSAPAIERGLFSQKQSRGTLLDHGVDFRDVVLANLQYEIFECGSVEAKGTIQYNGEELQDNILYDELSDLASEEPILIKRLPPNIAQVAKRGYRAGKPDTQPPTEKDPNQLPLEEGAQTPEEAFTQAAMGQVWMEHPDDEKFDSIEALLRSCMEEEVLEVHEELTVEFSSGGPRCCASPRWMKTPARPAMRWFPSGSRRPSSKQSTGCQPPV